MHELAELIRRSWDNWDPLVETAIFGTADAGELASRLAGFVDERLGSVAGAIFYTPGVGIVVGLRLTDGREVVVKVHRWNVTIDRPAAIQKVQAHAAQAGLPAPLPLVPPEPLAGGIATVEGFLPAGDPPTDAETVSRILAFGLHRFITATPPAETLPAIGRPLVLRPPGAPLWWEPHDVRFDFERTAAGAAWIDELATLARTRLDRAGALGGDARIGHFDWRVENLGLESDRIVGIYDWDSLALAPEPVIVGNAAAQFPTDWKRHDPDPLPTVAGMRGFVRDYELARGHPFTPAELELVDAANLGLCTYGARCQHSDMVLHPRVGGEQTTRWLRLLRERGADGFLTEE